MSELNLVMDQLLDMFGDTVTVYDHQGYTDQGDDFWYDDQDWANSGTDYLVVFEDQPSDEALDSPGFAEDADSAIWAGEDIAEEGDKISYNSEDYLTISVSDFRVQGELARQLVGVKRMEE